MNIDSKKSIHLINQLRATGTKVVLATDNMDSFVRWTIPALGLTNYFDDILDSFSLKALKRDFDEQGNSRFFSGYLSKNNLLPTDCVLIDDSPDIDNNLTTWGITYRQIDPIVGLEQELKKILNKTV